MNGEKHNDTHNQWDAGGYCMVMVIDNNGDGDTCGYRKPAATVTPRPIAFSDIRAGDLIRAERSDVSIEGVAALMQEAQSFAIRARWMTSEGFVLATPNDRITLIRPAATNRATALEREWVIEAAFAQIADEEQLTIFPTEHGATVPGHWRAQAEERAQPYIALLEKAGILASAAKESAK